MAGEDGFTLVETVIAMLLLAVIMAGVSGLIYTGLLAGERAGNQTVALNLAQAVLESLKEGPALADDDDVPKTSFASLDDEYQGFSGYAYQVTVAPHDERLNQVSVQVFYPLRDTERVVNLSTLVAKP